MSQKNQDYVALIQEATASLKDKLSWDQLKKKPKVGVVLGSGLGEFTLSLKEKKIVPYREVANMPSSSVSGHAGQWALGATKNNHPILVAQGRYHHYEGHSDQMVTLPIRMMHALGITHVILTNAAASLHLDIQPGDFVLIEDHINLTGHSPLRGVFSENLGPRFVDMSEAYDRALNKTLFEICAKKKPELRMHKGIYCALTGPQYETPAEIRMLQKLGADTVGMSTVPECIAANPTGLTASGHYFIPNYHIVTSSCGS